MSSLDRILPFLKPIEDLLVDPAVTEVMVNGGGRQVFVERRGCIEHVPDRSLEVRNLTVAIKNIARACGDEISERQPMLDARLEDGSRVAAMFPPCAVDGPTLTVRKFTQRFTLDDLIAVGTLTAPLSDLLHAAVGARHNILISGGTGTGKTTLLNAVAQTIPPQDRIVLIEETSEILIDKPNLVRFEARRAQVPLGQEEPMPAVTIADLVRATLRHRPDRILVGEVRGPEAFDLLQALNTGHLGSMTTIHANNAEQALTRLAHCVLTANVGLPHRSTREAITLAIHLVVHLARLDAKRVVTEVVRVQNYDPQSDRFVVEAWSPPQAVHEGATAKLSAVILTAAALLSCGREGTPTGPSGPTSFLTGTWRGTVTIQVNPGDPNPPAPTSGDMTWTFEVVPQTNMQSLRATIRSTHPWLTMETTGSTALSPGNSPPTEISTHGEFNSPRGCRGTFGSVGTAQATRIEADFTGTDCQLATFSGRVVLTKQ